MPFFKLLSRKQRLGKAWLTGEYETMSDQELEKLLFLAKDEMKESNHFWLTELHNFLETKLVDENLLSDDIDYEWSFHSTDSI